MLLRYEYDFNTVDDLSQDVFTRAVESAEAFKGDSTELTWLCGIAKNVGRNHVRKLLHSPDLLYEHESVVTLAGDDDEGTAPYYDASSVCEASDDPAANLQAVDAMADRMATLPSLIADVVILKVENKTYEEISRILGISEGYARVLAHRGKKLCEAL